MFLARYNGPWKYPKRDIPPIVLPGTMGRICAVAYNTGMSDIDIRLARLEDLMAYTTLLQRTYTDAYVDERIGLTASCFSSRVFASADTQAYLSSHLACSDTRKSWLAFDGDRLVGAVTCTIRSDTEAELTGFYVDTGHQGKGIGRRLYNLALAFAGKRDVLLDVYAHDTKAIALYTRWGWKRDVTRGDHGLLWRHWPEWPEGVHAKSLYFRLPRER